MQGNQTMEYLESHSVHNRRMAKLLLRDVAKRVVKSDDEVDATLLQAIDAIVEASVAETIMELKRRDVPNA